MPVIVDYALALSQLLGKGFHSLYYNSGAFGFPDDAATESVGWVGPDDPTLRPAARALAHSVPPPYEQNLAKLLVGAWQHRLPGKIWLMPKSHWAYELDFGNRDWLPGALQQIGVDPGALQSRTNASPIEFDARETAHFSQFIEASFAGLLGSDFALAFPGRPVVCTLHHHTQVWWTSTDRELIAQLKAAATYGS